MAETFFWKQGGGNNTDRIGIPLDTSAYQNFRRIRKNQSFVNIPLKSKVILKSLEDVSPAGTRYDETLPVTP